MELLGEYCYGVRHHGYYSAVEYIGCFTQMASSIMFVGSYGVHHVHPSNRIGDLHLPRRRVRPVCTDGTLAITRRGRRYLGLSTLIGDRLDEALSIRTIGMVMAISDVLEKGPHS